MNLNIATLKSASRILIETELTPLQGTRFQPTGFPDMGAAEYDGPDGRRMLLVESDQSMANRLEAVCWDMAGDDWIDPLKGLPLVKVQDGKGKPLTNSVLEAHRLNSEYIARATDFEPIKAAIGFEKGRPFDIRKQLVPALLKYDPNSLIHGTFLEEIAGVIRLERLLSAFIEAGDVRPAQSGGVKFNKVNPGLKEGEGNVPYSRTEYTSPEIKAFFKIDLSQLWGFGLCDEACLMLLAVMFYKIRRFLESGLRLRTACDFDVKAVLVTRPEGFALPETEALTKALPGLIKAVAKKGLFANPSTTIVTWGK